MQQPFVSGHLLLDWTLSGAGVSIGIKGNGFTGAGGRTGGSCEPQVKTGKDISRPPTFLLSNESLRLLH